MNKKWRNNASENPNKSAKPSMITNAKLSTKRVVKWFKNKLRNLFAPMYQRFNANLSEKNTIKYPIIPNKNAGKYSKKFAKNV